MCVRRFCDDTTKFSSGLWIALLNTKVARDHLGQINPASYGISKMPVTLVAISEISEPNQTAKAIQS